MEHIQTNHGGRPFEHLEAELETAYAERVRYFRAELVKKVRWILEAWKDTRDDE